MEREGCQLSGWTDGELRQSQQVGLVGAERIEYLEARDRLFWVP
jgi:hypothetical protein